MTDITMAIDCGASGTRVIFTPKDFKPELLLMEAGITRATRQALEDYSQSALGSTSPAQSGWVEYEGEFHAFGYAARGFKANLQLKKRKFELALPKVLAVIGAISEEKNLPNGTAIKLGTVLPWSEYSDRKLFHQLLTQALTSFQFCGTKKSFTLDTFLCIPEGGGVLFQGREPGSSFQNLNLIVLMMGFRDISLLFVDKGQMSSGLTEPLGFSHLCKFVAKQTGFRDHQKLAQSICKAGKNLNSKALLPLLGNLGKAYRESKLEEIKEAITWAKEQYLLKISELLEVEIESSVDEIIVAGGTANFLRTELNTILKQTPAKNVLWCENLEKRIRSSFSTQIKENSLQYRLADVYGLFFYLYGRTSKVGAGTQ